MPASSSELASGIRTLRESFAQAGRDAWELQVPAGLDRADDPAGTLDLDATFAGLDTLQQRGVPEPAHEKERA